MVRSSSHAWRWSSRRSNKARPPRRRKAPQVDHPPPRRRCLLCPCSPCPHTVRVLVQKLLAAPTPQHQRCSAPVGQYRWQTHGTVVVAVEVPRSPRHGNGTQLRLQVRDLASVCACGCACTCVCPCACELALTHTHTVCLTGSIGGGPARSRRPLRRSSTHHGGMRKAKTAQSPFLEKQTLVKQHSARSRYSKPRRKPAKRPQLAVAPPVDALHFDALHAATRHDVGVDPAHQVCSGVDECTSMDVCACVWMCVRLAVFSG